MTIQNLYSFRWTCQVNNLLRDSFSCFTSFCENAVDRLEVIQDIAGAANCLTGWIEILPEINMLQKKILLIKNITSKIFFVADVLSIPEQLQITVESCHKLSQNFFRNNILIENVEDCINVVDFSSSASSLACSLHDQKIVDLRDHAENLEFFSNVANLLSDSSSLVLNESTAIAEKSIAKKNKLQKIEKNLVFFRKIKKSEKAIGVLSSLIALLSFAFSVNLIIKVAGIVMSTIIFFIKIYGKHFKINRKIFDQ